LLAMLANDKTKAIILRAEEGANWKGSQRLRYCKSKPNQSCFGKAKKTTVLQKNLSYMKYLETEEEKII
jgi:hypothetical protein